jgi:hypothetical protein
MKLKHPDIAKYHGERVERESLTYCGFCGLMVKNWREHIQQSHPEEIAKHVRKKKSKEENLEEDYTKMFGL